MTIQQIIAQNRILADTLGWGERILEIYRYLGFKDYCPDEETFAHALMRWQQRNCLIATGLLDTSTWAIMQLEVPPILPNAISMAIPKPVQAQRSRAEWLAQVKHTHKLSTLDPIFRQKAENVLIKLVQDGYPIRIVWGLRTLEQNNALVQKGVASKTSLHLQGKAMDVIHRIEAYEYTDENKAYWNALGKYAKEEGLVWGGDFESRYDPTHIELK